MEIVDDRKVRLHLSEATGLVLGRMRATHITTARFWRDLDTEPVITDGDDRTWLQTEDRPPSALRANPYYWAGGEGLG